MKKIWTLLLITGFFACNRVPSDMVEVRGFIENPTDTEVEVFYYKDYLLHETEKVTVSLSRNNKFKARLPMDQARFAYIGTQGRTISLYLRPGASVWMGFDAEDVESRVEIKGSMFYESGFLTAYVDDIDEQFGRDLVINRIARMNASMFNNYLDSIYSVKMEYLNNYENFNQLDSNFVRVMQTDISYDRYTLLLEYPLYYAYFHNLSEPVNLFDGYYDFLEDVDHFEDHLIDSRAYRDFLNTYLNHLIEQNPYDVQEGKSYYQIMYEYAKDYFEGVGRDFILSQVVISALNFDDFELAQIIYDDYSDGILDSSYQSIVDEEYQTVLGLTPGNPAPDFTLTELYGDTISLSDFQGKVVFIDFWASWCDPCIREIGHAREIMKQMAVQHDLVFLHVSIDTDEAAWKTSVTEQDIQGIHVNVSGPEHGVPALYNIKGIPSFFIIGRDGKIFDNRPPRPSNPLLLSSLMTALLQ